MEAKLTKRPMTIEEIIALIPLEAPIKRGHYFKSYVVSQGVVLPQKATKSKC